MAAVAVVVMMTWAAQVLQEQILHHVFPGPGKQFQFNSKAKYQVGVPRPSTWHHTVSSSKHFLGHLKQGRCSGILPTLKQGCWTAKLPIGP